MEKLSASLLASIASVLMFLVLRREGIRWALPLALVFAFGTNTWMISSQALWQHGTGELLVALALLLAVARASPVRTGLLGFVCVLMAANRPPDALIAGAFVLFAVWRRRRDAVWLLAGAALPLAALLYYNLGFIGHLAGGYAAARVAKARSFFHLDLLGLAGLLVSPARGLLVFSPFLVFVPVGLIQRLRDTGLERAGRRAQRCRRRPAPAVLAGGLARRGVVGSALAHRPAADPGVDARARAARPAPVRTRAARRDDGGGGRRAGDRRLLVHEDERRAHLRGRPRVHARRVGSEQHAVPRRAAPSRPRPASFSAARAVRSIGRGRRCSATTAPSPSWSPARCSKDGRSPAGARPPRCWC